MRKASGKTEVRRPELKVYKVQRQNPKSAIRNRAAGELGEANPKSAEADSKRGSFP